MVPHPRRAMRPSHATGLPSKTRGRREDRVRAAPAVSRAVCTKQNAHEHTGPAENTRPSLRNGFTAYGVLSPENGSFASVAPRKRLPPSALTPAPRRQDHTLLPYAQAALVGRNLGVHRNPSNVRDDGRRPLSRTGWRRICSDLDFCKSEIFLISRLDMISVNRKMICPPG